MNDGRIPNPNVVRVVPSTRGTARADRLRRGCGMQKITDTEMAEFSGYFTTSNQNRVCATQIRMACGVEKPSDAPSAGGFSRPLFRSRASSQARRRWRRGLQCRRWPHASWAHCCESPRRSPTASGTPSRAADARGGRACSSTACVVQRWENVRIVVALGISGGRSLTGPFRDARRFPSTL